MTGRTNDDMPADPAGSRENPGDRQAPHTRDGDPQDFTVEEMLIERLSDVFPYPVAVYTREYKIMLVNRAFAAETGVRSSGPERSSFRILRHRIGDAHLLSAVSGVFSGDTFILENIKDPFSMFSGIIRRREDRPERFSRTLIFPLPDADAEITFGVIAFIA